MKLRKLIGLAVAGALPLGSTALVSSPVAADDVGCGSIITQSIRLTHDIGPCSGNGLVVRADDITVDLGGHRIFADNVAREQIGIRLGNVTGVTVQDGTVEGFDAGVEILSGGGNTVQRIRAVNNRNDMLEPFVFVPGQPQMDPAWQAQMLCFYGDGITTTESDDNLIVNNDVSGSGPYGGITLVGDSDGNKVVRNRLSGNNIRNWTLQNTPTGRRDGSGLCGATLPGAPGMQRGREVQASGIRIEGPGADRNTVELNSVDNSALTGISIHSWVCNPVPGEPRPGFPNEYNVVKMNMVTRTGLETVSRDPYADGISVLASGPIGRVTCTSWRNTITGNQVTENLRHGISLFNTVQLTTVTDNVVTKNGADGLLVAGPSSSGTPGATNNTLAANRGSNNGRTDGVDGNANCDNNAWTANRFLTINQACVAGGGGTGWVGGPGSSGDAPGQQEEADIGARPARAES